MATDVQSMYDVLANKMKDVESAFVSTLGHATVCDRSNGLVKLRDSLQQIKELTRRCELRLTLEEGIAGSRNPNDALKPRGQTETCLGDVQSEVLQLRHTVATLQSCLFSQQERKGLEKGVGSQKGKGKFGKNVFPAMGDVASNIPVISELEFKIHGERLKFDACIAKYPISSSSSLCKLLDVQSILNRISVFVGLDWGYYGSPLGLPFDFKLFPWSDRWDTDYRGIALDRMSEACKHLRRLSRVTPWVKIVVPELAEVLWSGMFPENAKYIDEKREYNLCEHFERKGSCRDRDYCRFIHCTSAVRHGVCAYILWMYASFSDTNNLLKDLSTEAAHEIRFRRSIRRCVAELDDISKPSSESGLINVRGVLKKYMDYLNIQLSEINYEVPKGKGKGKAVIVA